MSSVVRAEASGPLDSVLRRAREKKLADHPEWKRLLHFRKGRGGRERSDIQKGPFFLSPQGPTNAWAELEATLTAFITGKTDTALDQPSPCRFPARYDWLKEPLGLNEIVAPVTCERFDAWSARLAPQSVSLVFASYYMNNPASMYGHTFFTLNRSSTTSSHRLLDYTVNFAAITDTNNGMMFAVKGLLGGYHGGFSTEPYYLKLQKYNNVEARDLWEYELNLSTPQIHRLMNHLWEIGPATMRYFFFNKNCSYQLLPLLEVAVPGLMLSDRFRFRAIPLDTLRAVIETPGLLKSSSIRPSHLRQMVERRSRLLKGEWPLVQELATGNFDRAAKNLDAMDGQRKIRVVDSAIDVWRTRSGFWRPLPLPAQQRERQLLLLRNRLPPMATEPAASLSFPAISPEKAHGTFLVGFGAGSTKTSGFQEIRARGALHDLESDPTGFVEGSQLEMMSVRLRRQNQSAQLYLEEGTLIGIKSLSPWDPWIRKPSWAVRSGFRTAHDRPHPPRASLIYDTSGGSGLSVGGTRAIFYGMITAEAAVSGVLNDSHRIGAGGEMGLVWRPSSAGGLVASAGSTKFMTGETGTATRFRAAASLAITKKMGVRLSWKREQRYQETLFTVTYQN